MPSSTLNVYNKDGSILLGSGNADLSYKVTDTGIVDMVDGSYINIAFSNSNVIGYASTPNQTTPNYQIGSTDIGFGPVGTYNLYEVEGDKYTINATKSKITINCQDKTMEKDIIVRFTKTPTQTKTVEFNPGSANSITITPDEGYVLSSVEVGKPTTMIPSNIKSGVNIGGVVGTYEGSTVSKGLIFKDYDSSGYPKKAVFEGNWTTIPDYMCSSLFKTNNYFKNIKSLEIPQGVNRLGHSAFSSCDSLTSITLPDSITYIDFFAFSYCSNLTNITIPVNVKTIKNSALSCGSSENKTTFTFKSTTPPSIGSQAFNTNYINKIYVPSSAVSTYKSATNWSSLSSYIQANPNE